MRSYRGCHLVLTLVVATLTSFAANGGVQSRAPQQRFALFIGAESEILDAAAHQRSLAELLRKDFGYRQGNVVEIYGESATSVNIQKALRLLRQRMNPDDSLFVHVALPSMWVNEDLAAIVYDSDVNRPWTVWSSTDMAKWLAELSGLSVFAIIPTCSESRGGFFLRDLLYSGKVQGLDVAMLCDQTTGLGEKTAFVLEHFLRSESTVESRRALAEIQFRIQSPLIQQIAGSTGSYSEFVFIRESGRLTPYVVDAQKGETTSLRVAAVQKIVKAVEDEPEDRRPSLAAQATEAIEPIAFDNDRVLRLTVYWALGEMRHPRSVPVLTTRFAFGDEDERRQIIDALAKIGGDSAGATVRLALDDPSAIVRLEAVRAAGVLCDEGMSSDLLLETVLLTMGRNDPDPAVRSGVLQALAATKDARVHGDILDLVRNAFRDPDPSVRRLAVSTWVELGHTAVIQPLLSMLTKTETSTDVRQAIAFALGRNKSPETQSRAVDILAQILRSRTDAPVREAAAFSLGQLGNTSAQRALMFAAESELEDGKVRVAAIDALAAMKAGALDVFTTAAASSNPDVSRAAIRALGESGDPRALLLLFNAASSADPHIRNEAAKAIDKIRPGGRRLQSLLIANLEHTVPTVRAEAAEKLAAYPNEEVAEVLVAHLSDDDKNVRNAIISTLVGFSGEHLGKPVVAALDSKDPDVKKGAIGIVGAQGRDELRDKITSLANDVDLRVDVRAEAVRALKYLGAPETIFIVLSSSAEPEIRMAAVDGLSNFDTQPVVAALTRLAKDKDPAVRDAAIAALRKSLTLP